MSTTRSPKEEKEREEGDGEDREERGTRDRLIRWERECRYVKATSDVCVRFLTLLRSRCFYDEKRGREGTIDEDDRAARNEMFRRIRSSECVALGDVMTRQIAEKEEQVMKRRYVFVRGSRLSTRVFVVVLADERVAVLTERVVRTRSQASRIDGRGGGGGREMVETDVRDEFDGVQASVRGE